MPDINNWDVAAANNNDAPPDGWPENTMNYGDVNNTAREGMAVIARYYKDTNGSLTTAGAANTYTLTLNQNSYTSWFAGLRFTAKINATNTGAATINPTSSVALGAQAIVDRDGNALTGGELVSGAIYEFYYDGTNVQFIGSADTNASFTSLNVSSSTATDLVDTDNALNVGAADPTASPHVAVDPNSVQAKANGTTAADLHLNPLGGAVTLYYAGSAVVITEATSVALRSATTANVALDLEGSGGTINARLIAAAAGPLTLQSQVHGGDVVLSGEDAGGVDRNLFTANPDGAATLYYDANKTLDTTTTGIDVFSATNDNPKITFYQDDGSTANAFLQALGTGQLELRSLVHGGLVKLQGEDTGGTARNLLVGDPDASITLYYAGVQTLDTNTDGVNVSATASDNPYIGFYQDDFSTRNGFIQFNGAGSTLFRSEVHGGNVQLQGEDAGGTTRLLLIGDPDDAVGLYYAGTKVMRTRASADGGVEVDNTSTGAGFERVLTVSDLGAAESQSSFTPTWTGFSTAPTGDIDYSITGNKVTLKVSGTRHGTSNTSTMSITNLPGAITPTTSCNVFSGPYRNLGSDGRYGVAEVSSAGNINFLLLGDSSGVLVEGSFGSSSSKGLNSSWTITYDLT